jgi:hypothetical protein
MCTSGDKAKHCWVMSTNFLFQKFVDITHQCFALLPQVNFPANKIFTEGEGDWIESRLSSEIFSTLLLLFIFSF